jgi:hypothetical protein
MSKQSCVEEFSKWTIFDETRGKKTSVLLMLGHQTGLYIDIMKKLEAESSLIQGHLGLIPEPWGISMEPLEAQPVL